MWAGCPPHTQRGSQLLAQELLVLSSCLSAPGDTPDPSWPQTPTPALERPGCVGVLGPETCCLGPQCLRDLICKGTPTGKAHGGQGSAGEPQHRVSGQDFFPKVPSAAASLQLVKGPKPCRRAPHPSREEAAHVYPRPASFGLGEGTGWPGSVPGVPRAALREEPGVPLWTRTQGSVRCSPEVLGSKEQGCGSHLSTVPSRCCAGPELRTLFAAVSVWPCHPLLCSPGWRRARSAVLWVPSTPPSLATQGEALELGSVPL